MSLIHKFLTFPARTVQIAVLLSVLIWPADLVIAQTTEPSQGATIEINPLTVKGLVVGKRLSFGAEFAAKHNIAVPIPFSFTVPTDRTKNIKVEPAPGGSGIYKVNFATADNLLKSSLQIVPITIPLRDEAARIDDLAKISRQAFIASVVDPDKADITVRRRTEIGPYLAVEVLGRYADNDGKVVVLRTVAIVGSDSNHGVVGIVNALPDYAGITKVEDILLVDGSRALSTFRFE